MSSGDLVLTTIRQAYTVLIACSVLALAVVAGTLVLFGAADLAMLSPLAVFPLVRVLAARAPAIDRPTAAALAVVGFVTGAAYVVITVVALAGLGGLPEG